MCRWCDVSFATNRRGRPQLYCCPSHKVRDCQERRFAEFKEPSQRTYRLLVSRLQSLQRSRMGWGLESETLSLMGGELFRRKPYEAAVVRVRQTLDELAPEIFQVSDSASRGFNRSEFDNVYRRLVLENHPDCGGNPHIMRAVNELRQALQADFKRARRLDRKAQDRWLSFPNIGRW